MSYQEMSDVYQSQSFKSRSSACIREQAQTFVSSPDPAVAYLAKGVISSNQSDIDAIQGYISTGPSSGDLGDDTALLASVQAAWPIVANAKYGGMVGAMQADSSGMLNR